MEFGIVALVLLLDQVTKYWVANSSQVQEGITVIRNFLYFTYVKNTGAAWSMLSGQQVFLVLVTVVEIGVLLYMLQNYRKKNLKLARIALAMMIGGAFGNLIDRLALGFVRDFIDTYPFGYNFPVFNVADMALCIGVGLLMIQLIKEDREEKAEK